MLSNFYKKIIRLIGFISLRGLILVSLVGLIGLNVNAQSVDQLRQNIENQRDKIKQLDEEIKIYEKQIETTNSQAQTLKSTIQVLDINQKKIGTEIKKTETNINKTNLTIQDINDEIIVIESKVDANTKAIAKTLNSIYQNDAQSLIENFLTDGSLTDIFDKYDSMTKFQESVRFRSRELESQKLELSNKKALSEKEKQNLVSFKSELNDQNQILVNNKKEKSTLLTITKNKETEYKRILAQTQAEKERFEKELFDFESQLKRAIDPNSFPSSGKGIFVWPLDKILITQNFGKTVDAKRLYTSGTHNGVDFGISRGTPVKSTLSGVVRGTGNTDAQKGCYSYGKWILVDHPNGLSTMYAHLDLIKVSARQEVQTGQIIGYSGNTGYSTGPHLHLTVYATQGIVGIQKYSSSKNCKNVSIPIADVKAYLDPMLYF